MIHNAKVIEVIDGDTILVHIEETFTSLLNTITITTPARVRLLGINAPERNEEGYQEAKNTLHELVFQKDVVLNIAGKDKYDRLLADVFLASGVKINDLLLEQGLVKPYPMKAGGGKKGETNN